MMRSRGKKSCLFFFYVRVAFLLEIPAVKFGSLLFAWFLVSDVISMARNAADRQHVWLVSLGQEEAWQRCSLLPVTCLTATLPAPSVSVRLAGKTILLAVCGGSCFTPRNPLPPPQQLYSPPPRPHPLPRAHSPSSLSCCFPSVQ